MRKRKEEEEKDIISAEMEVDDNVDISIISKEWELMVERSGFYWNLVFAGAKYTNRTSQVKFIRGWIKRCFKL